jgi:hypothetical protein
MKLLLRGSRAETLESFYLPYPEGTQDDLAERRSAMLDLIRKLESSPSDYVAWCQTSHLDLILLAAEKSGTPWSVRITALNGYDYVVDYLMPAAIAPWPDAHVTGLARLEGPTAQMVLAAMVRSGAWPAQSNDA